ncbi:MAG: hypothetical protein R3E48_16520 [Burkholderiaceae bacterium]
MSDVTVPMFIVGTETDHVAPYGSRSTRSTTWCAPDDFTFLLTSGDPQCRHHQRPRPPKRRYRKLLRRLADPHLAPEDWMERAEQQQGSWWPAWEQWLVDHSTASTKPPAMGASRKGYGVLEDAPGQYVRQR